MAYRWASSVTNFIVANAQFLAKIITEWLKQCLFLFFFVRKNGATPWWQNILPLRRRQAALKTDLERSPSSRIYRFVIRKSCYNIIYCILYKKKVFLTQRLQEYCRHDTTVSRIKPAAKLLKLNFRFILHRIGEEQKLKGFTWYRKKKSFQT